MANTMAVQDVQPGDRGKTVVLKVTLSGSYVQFNSGTNAGEQLKIDTASNPNDLPYPGFSVRGADRGYMISGPAGYSAQILQSANGSYFLKIYSAVGTELAAGAYPAAITSDGNIIVAFDGKNF